MRSVLYLFLLLWVFTSPLGGAIRSNMQSAPPLSGAVRPVAAQRSDSAAISTYEVHSDSLALVVPDSVKAKNDSLKKKKPLLENPIQYKATDSISFSQSEQKGEFYRDGSIQYGTMNLTADTIHLDLAKKTIFAWAGADSVGGEYGAPKFAQGSDQFDTKSMSYNFDTKRGSIRSIKSTQGEAIVHAMQAKRYESGHIHMADGKITTCTADNPHFYLHTNRVKIMPENKIVFGFSYLVLEDVPLPLFLPFGLIPNTKKKAVNGLIPPGFGVETTRGMYLTDGGYYFEFNDKIDGTVTADIYSQGTWGIKLDTRYKVKYRYNGSANIRYYTNVTGEKGINRTKNKQYSINWTHTQDPKANPYRSFSASVNYSTSEYDKTFNYTNSQALFTTTKTSSISYRKSWPNSPFRLTANLNHSQSSTDNMMRLSLPIMSFSMDKIYPFRAKEAVGKSRWYEDFGITYSADMQNTLSGKENEIFSSKSFKNMNNGFSHSIPLSLNLKVLRIFNINPTVNYRGVLYSQQVHKSYDADYINPYNGQIGQVVTDTLKGMVYGHSASPSLSISTTPKFYLTVLYGRPGSQPKIQALRYVFAPTVSFRYVPDMNGIMPNYYQTYIDKNGREVKYSIFETGVYGTPSLPGKSGTISIGLNNNLELKVRDTKGDSVSSRKVNLFERLNFSTGYNIFADSMKWSMISFNASVKLLSQLNLDIRGTLDPYALNANGNRYNTLEIKENGRIGRLTNLGFSTSYNFSSKNQRSPEPSSDQNSESSSSSTAPKSQPKGNFDYFNAPWSLNIGYDFNLMKPRFKSTVMQTVTLSGSISPTPKWQMTFSSGYDIKAKEVTHTSFGLTRDLHCWQMSMNFSPFGAYKFYMFRINVKASILQDLKYESRKDRRDFTNWGL